MERDFLGLATNSSSPAIKQETNDACNDSAADRGTGHQWYFPDSVLNTPKVLFSNSRLEENPTRSLFDPIQSPRFVTASTTDYYSQRNMASKQSYSPSQIVLASSSLEQSGVQPVYHPESFKMHSLTNNQNESTSSAINYTVMQSHTYRAEHHMGKSSSNSPSFGRVPPVSPASRVPSPICFPTYAADKRSSSKPLTAPAQMTIFYAGSVSVYDNISSEKAQAIMLLAGNGTSTTPATAVPSTQLQAPYTKLPLHDTVCIGNSSHTASSTGLASHVSMIPHIASRNGGVSNQRSMTSQQQPEPSRAVYSQRLPIGYAVPGPVPQARKASLARFLERRKERVTNSQPYPLELKSSERERSMSSASDGLSFTLRSPS